MRLLSGWVLLLMATSASAQTILLSPGSLDFGGQLLGRASAVREITLTNIGKSDLTISQLSLTGPSVQAFQRTSGDLGSVKPLESVKIALVFTPAVLGMASAVLEIFSDDPYKAVAPVKLGGLGISSVLGGSPAAIDFGSAKAGSQSIVKSFAITNASGDSITLLEAALGGASASYKLDSVAGQISAGQTKTVNVTFLPAMGGDLSATVMLATSDQSLPKAVVMLMGKGIPMGLSAMPASLSFSDVVVGNASSASSVTLTNLTSAPLQLLSVSSDSPLFTVSPVDDSAIAAGAKTTFSVVFTPTKVGMPVANLAVHVAGASTPDLVVIASGTGIAVVPSGSGCAIGPGRSVSRGVWGALGLLWLAAYRRKAREP